MRIALVTSDGFPEPHWHDADAPLVADELRRRGADVDRPLWDGSEPVDWRSFDALVLQSPWSMWRDLAGFRAWVGARSAEGALLLNPAGVLRLGSDKRYLAALSADVPVVPTTLFERGTSTAGLPGLLPLRQERRTVVVKPVASGGAMDAREFADPGAAAAYVETLHAAGSAAIVQPYVEAIDTHRELGVLTLDGVVSHAITKAAILRPGDDSRAFHPDPRPFDGWTGRLRDVVDRTYAALCELLPADDPEPLSVRLDFIVAPDSPQGLLLLEAELVAPVKFFALHPAECGRFADAIVRRAS